MHISSEEKFAFYRTLYTSVNTVDPQNSPNKGIGVMFNLTIKKSNPIEIKFFSCFIRKDPQN